MQPLVEEAPIVRGSWDLTVFYELLRRGLEWAKEPAKAEA